MQRRAADWLLSEHMAEVENNSVATAIRGAEFEGFVAGTLFSQGWNVTYRALDIESLLTHLDSAARAISLLLISTDVEGLTPDNLHKISKRGIKFFLFASTTSAQDLYPESVPQPTTSLELLGLIRGSLRTPMIRGARKEKVRARTIALASPSPTSGCTTLTINLGAELAQLGRKVLIVDAHAYFPTFAIRLGERGLNSSMEYRNISPHLWALEITQSEIGGAVTALERARNELGRFSELSGVRVPLATSSWVNRSHSASEPSHHSMRSGVVNSATSATQARRRLFFVGASAKPGIAELLTRTPWLKT